MVGAGLTQKQFLSSQFQYITSATESVEEERQDNEHEELERQENSDIEDELQLKQERHNNLSAAGRDLEDSFGVRGLECGRGSGEHADNHRYLSKRIVTLPVDESLEKEMQSQR